MSRSLVITIPPLDTTRPPAAGAIVSAVCKSQGHNVTAIDLQIEFNDYLRQHNLDQSKFDAVFYDSGLEFDYEQQKHLQMFINHWAQNIADRSADYVLISLFSYLSQRFATEFLLALKQRCKSKVIIGGSGVTAASFDVSNQYGANILKQGLIDAYITGEAEQALVDYFTLGSGPGINNYDFQQINNLDHIVKPDYSYYNLDNYPSPTGSREVVIVGSRGCVRSCTFCDVAKTSPRYRYRSGADIAAEIINNYENHGVCEFYFADSLVNGSLRAFDDMCSALARYRFSDHIAWRGQYIIRPRQTVPSRHFDMLQKSGCKELFVGIETGSDRVRWEIGKKFTNDDIEYHLQGFERAGISALFLFFTGYVTETLVDHQETLKMFPRWQRYVASGTISGIETLNILTILPGTPLEQIARDHHYDFATNSNGTANNLFWTNPANPQLTFPERLRRHIEMMETAMQYHWPIWNGELSLEIFERALDQYHSLPRGSQRLTMPIKTLQSQNTPK